MNIVFRVDGSTQIGLGHVMRCLTLLQQTVEKHDAYFVSFPLPEHIEKLIKNAGAILLPLKTNDVTDECQRNLNVLSETAQINHANACLCLLDKQIKNDIDILIVDHYSLSAPFEKHMRIKARHIVVIDDLADRFHECDILIDQNLFKNYQTRYQHLVPPSCQLLLGPSYSILRKEFYEPNLNERKSNHIFVCFGGSDPVNMTTRVVDTLIKLKSFKFTADIVVGSGYDHKRSLAQKIKDQSNIKLHTNCSNMSALMSKASTAIGAGGGMHWERAKTKASGLIITLAENQIETTRYLHEQNCCMWLGHYGDVTDDVLDAAIEHILASPDKVIEIAQNAYKLLGKNQSSTFVMDTILKTIKRSTCNQL